MSHPSDGRPPGRITLQMLAEHLGVSTATISLSLRNSSLVAEATRLRVHQAARELGYVYNRSAASLRTSRTNIIAVGVHDITNPYFAELLSTIEAVAARTGRSVLLGTYLENLERAERVITTLKEYRPDGMIVCPPGGSRPEMLRDIATAGIPLVQISREIAGADLDFVGADDALGARLAIDHLAELGHRRIAYIGRNDLISTAHARHGAYWSRLGEHALERDTALVHPCLGTRDGGVKGMMRLLALPHPPTAVLCFNDLVAFGAMQALRHHGLEAGRDVSVIGCDDVKEAAQWFPALTTVHNRQDEMGAAATELLIRRMADRTGPVERIIFKPNLVLRATTAAPKR